MPMKSLLQRCKVFAKEEESASGIEYANVAVVLVTFSGPISTRVSAIFTAISPTLQGRH